MVAWRVDDAWRVATERIGFEGEGYGGQLRGARRSAGRRRAAVRRPVRAGRRTARWSPQNCSGRPSPCRQRRWRGWIVRWSTASRQRARRLARRSRRLAVPRSRRAHGRARRDRRPRRSTTTRLGRAPKNKRDRDLHQRRHAGRRRSRPRRRATASPAPCDDRRFRAAGARSRRQGRGQRRAPTRFPARDADRQALSGPIEGPRDRWQGRGRVHPDLADPPDRDAEPGRQRRPGAARLDHNDYDLHFTDASGKLAFNQNGFSAGPLDVGFRGSRAQALAGDRRRGRGPAATCSRHRWTGASRSVRCSPTCRRCCRCWPMSAANRRGPRASTSTARRTAPRPAPRSASTAISSAPRSACRRRWPRTPRPRCRSISTFRCPMRGRHFSARLGDLAVAKGRLPGADQRVRRTHRFRQRGGRASCRRRASRSTATWRTLDGGGWLDRVSRGSSGAGSLVHSIDVTIG